MAIEGKKRYSIYLDEKNVEYLREYFDTRPNTGGLSALLDKYLARCVFMVKENRDTFDGIEPGRMSFKKFWQLCKIQVKKMDEWKDQPND